VARPRLLLVSATTGYQAEGFRAAAARLGVELILATDRCDQLSDPWRDNAVGVRFEQPKPALEALRKLAPFQGITAIGDRAALLAAHIAAGLGLRFHSPLSAAMAHDKYAFRQALQHAGLPVPKFRRISIDADPTAAAAQADYPCVLKPLILSASRGVIRADDPAAFAAAFTRIRQLLLRPEIQQWRNPNAAWLLAESYIAGREVALEGWIEAGTLQRFAFFDKPDPLEGPFFEESIYITPSRLETAQRALIWDVVEAAARAASLGPGPIHAEIRLAPGRGGETAATPDTPYVLEIAARPIGGLCARALRFRRAPETATITLEELLLRGALGEPLAAWEREMAPAGVMMIPVPEGGILDRVDGVEAARQSPGVEAIEITAKAGEPLSALPEGSSYLGFIFARASTPAAVEQALRSAHARLDIHMRQALPVSGTTALR
jgi:biotin carboxylase